MRDRSEVTGAICTKWNERESTWRKSGSCQLIRGTSQNSHDDAAADRSSIANGKTTPQACRLAVSIRQHDVEENLSSLFQVPCVDSRPQSFLLNQLNGDRDPCLPANSLIRRSNDRPVCGIEIDEVDNDLIWRHATDQTVFVNLGSDDYHGSTLDDFFELRR